MTKKLYVIVCDYGFLDVCKSKNLIEDCIQSFTPIFGKVWCEQMTEEELNEIYPAEEVEKGK